MAINFNSSFNLGGAGFSAGFFPGASGLSSLGLNNSLFAGTGGLDGFLGSAGMNEGFGSPLGGLGEGFGNPMMGLGGFQGANLQQLQGMLFMLGRMMGSLMSQGMGGPGMGNFPQQCGPGGPGGIGMPGGPGGCGMPMPGGPQGPAGPCGVGGPGMAGGGQTIEMQKDSTFTTPGGATITWKGDEVKVNEPGGQQAQGAGAAGRGFGAGSGQFNMAAAMSGPGYSAALAISAGAGAHGACGCGAAHAGQDGKPRTWRVWGDPHIDHPNGSKSDFDRKNAHFTLQDGTQVLMCADNPKAVVNRVQIILPGGRPNWQGIDPAQTSVMRDDGTGHFKSSGPASQYMQGGFGAGQPFGMVA